MAKSSELIVGLDIGTTKICAVVGEVGVDGLVDIVGIGTSPSKGLNKGVVVNIEQTVQSIKKAVEDAELMAGCEIRSVYVGIAGSHIKGFNSPGVIAVKGGEVTARDIERVIDAARIVPISPDQQIIHILPQEFIVDNQSGIIEPLGMAGVRLEVKVHIVTGAVTSAQNIVKSCQKSGLDVEDIVLEAFASSKAVLTDEEREIGVALVDIGGGTSDIAIFHGNAIKHTGVVPFGGTNLTKDIAFGLRTSVQAAEKIKLEYGCVLPELVKDDEAIDVPSVGGRPPRKLTRQLLAEICEPRMEELLGMVDQELIRSGFKKVLGAGVVFTGGSSRIDGLQELADQVFNLPTRTASPTGVGGLKDVVDNPQYATAVGLLLYGGEKHGRANKIRTSDKNIFQSILKRMRQWFADVR